MAGQRRWLRFTAWTAGALGLLVLATWLAFRLSPWPSVLLIRHAFDQGAAEASGKLARHVPPGLREWRDGVKLVPMKWLNKDNEGDEASEG